MPDTSAVMAAFRAELVDAGLVRRPSDAGALPPMHVSPIDGPPAPGEREEPEDHPSLVLSLLYAGEAAGLDGYSSAIGPTIILDVRIRAKDTAARRAGMALQAAITGLLIRPETNYGYGFILGDDDVAIEVLSVGAEGGGPVSSSLATGFDDLAKYSVEVRR